ncbi:Hpt domain-containing protein [Thalassotalea sp. PLHSN55]|uniref:Hpt domain-containing protein n=1 Tax=Thalassotalea sp. PLHSN55 TaxID=3435888 RepID=UPI003F825318
MNEPEKKVLNREVMKNLIGDDDMALIRKFEIEFLQQAKVSMAKIVQLFGSNKLVEIKEEAHFLKTSAKAIGAEQVAEHLENLEQAGLDQDKEKCKALIMLSNQGLKAVYGAVKNES